MRSLLEVVTAKPTHLTYSLGIGTGRGLLFAQLQPYRHLSAKSRRSTPSPSDSAKHA
ncbi:hypothetical protein EJ08DRAFT_57328 [Tothia fuscella]|uniref:Uncharacterized protein n=1 Tax=Tothia fuscella TaxID=1048955 RepID=A0A9P4NXG3_9PEZI|nr:hypothetical protein EJ08DRAFT_57328 [Tothia fuscella]